MSAARNMADEARRGLGRGLSALIGEEPAAKAAPVAPGKGARTVPIAFLKPNRFQPRKRFSPEDLADLSNSIREKGVLQPILVRPVAGDANSFEIVAGERRWRAAQMAKLHDVPVVVREVSDVEALELAIIENIQRAELNPIEEAAAYQQLMEQFKYTQEKVAQEVGKSRSHIANSVRLLTLPASVQTMVQEGRLSAGHARTLVGNPSAEARAREIVEQALNVRQAEQATKKPTKPSTRPVEKDADTKALEASLSNHLGLKVEISYKEGKGGELTIAYKTLEQLDDLIRRLNKG